ncbi:MAG: hypothetical protein HYY17_14315 [Planctomycetes bacterium]|nr:hypothetical protein [Planctomycetota bacterium]
MKDLDRERRNCRRRLVLGGACFLAGASLALAPWVIGSGWCVWIYLAVLVPVLAGGACAGPASMRLREIALQQEMERRRR